MNSSTKTKNICPEFVDSIPRQLQSGVLYVSIKFSTTAHLCACGCGREVVAPLRPNRYRFTYDGKQISLKPSIGNWTFPCKSHYWIRRNEIEWSFAYSEEEISEATQLHEEAVDREFE